MKVLLFCAAAFALFYASSLLAVNGDTHEATPSEHARHRPVVTRPAKARPEHPPSLDKNLIAHIKRTLPQPLKSRLELLPFPFEVFFSQDRDDRQNVLQTLGKNAHVRSFYDDFLYYLLNNQDQIVKEVRRYMLRQQRLHPDPAAPMKAAMQRSAQGIQRAKSAAMRARANVQSAIDRANRHRMPRTQGPVAHTKVPSLIQQTKDAQKAAMDAVAKAKALSKPTKPQATRTKKPATPLYTKAKKLQNRKDLSKPPEGQSLLDSSPLMY